VPERPDWRRYKDRNRVLCIFGKIKQQYRIVARLLLPSFEHGLDSMRWQRVQIEQASG